MPLPRPGPHGGDGPAVATALGLDPLDLLDLSQTLNPFAPDAGEIVGRHLDAIGRYPDPSTAHAALSEAMGVDPDRLLLTNGGSEAIALVAAADGGRPLAEPEFGLHPRARTGPVWRSDPHNPSGVLAAGDERVDVWDEAFYPMATGRWTSGRPGTIVGSLTKVFACPGLRLGYVIDDDIRRLTEGRPAWALNSLALAALPELLEAADLPTWRDRIVAARSELAAVCTGAGFEVDEADAPWVLVCAPGLRERLAPLGVLVRDCASFGMPEHARIAVTDDAGLQRLADALGSVG